MFPLYAGGDRGAPRWAIVLALPTALACALLEAARLVGWSSVTNAHTLHAVFVETQFGRAWLVHLALAGALTLLARKRRVLSSALLAGLALASLAGIGHSGMHDGALGTAHRFVHAGHLLAVGAWFGGLEPLHQYIKAAAPTLATRATRRFSHSGQIAVALVLAAGIADIALIKGSTAFYSAYLFALALKLSAVFAILCIAAYNRFVASHPFQPALLLRSIRIEQAFFALVVVAAIVLGSLSPTASAS